MAGEYDYDVVVIGSGFGGAVTACRLAEDGRRVLVLERGHRWGPRKGVRDEGNESGDQRDPDVMPYPRGGTDAWLWDHEHPERRHGWLDFREFPHMGVIQGAGVGGGSLIYANVSIDADPKTFKQEGWPRQITFDTLKPYYAMVGKMLEVAKVPTDQWSERVKLLKAAADTKGWGDRFHAVDVAVRFSGRFPYQSSMRPDPARSERVLNPHGAWQGTCAHLANCDIGCDVGAKNTLDKNYLFVAEKRGAEIRPLHLVRTIEPEAGGYRVHFDRIAAGGFEPGSVSGRIVIVAAGSLGSTELLLRCKGQYRTLPALSDALGQRWSSNGDFLTPALHLFRKTLYPGRGITIAGSINFPDGDPHRFIIEDGGIPYQAVSGLIGALTRNRGTGAGLRHTLLHAAARVAGAGYDAMLRLSRRPFMKPARPVLELLNPVNYVMPWFAQGQDAGDGTLRLKDGELYLDWPWKDSEPLINAIYDTHKKLARSTWGLVLPPITWTLFHSLITPHPLGGCNMGEDATSGVVDHKGEVFGYPRLYVADGAIVPQALGLNPSKTIAALAERIAEHIRQDHPRGGG